MTCLDVISRSTPVSAPTFRRNPIPRILHRAIIKKRRLWRRYVSHTSSSRLAAFKAQSRLVSSLYRIHRSRHELRVLLTYSNQNFWRFCSKRTSSSNSCFPLPMTYSGLTVTDLASLPNTFNSFFTSIFNANPPNGTLLFRHNVYTPLLSSVHLSPNDILSALLTVKPKFNSPDGIPGYYLKTFAPLLVHPLTVIFNSSLSTASLPLDWKHTTVTPLYKGKGPTNDVANYRPISCTSVTGKVFESLVKTRLLSHFMANSLLSNDQFGFLPGRSTTSNLLYTDHLIHTEIHKGNAVDVILFDISKAFDTVPHASLLNKLTSNFGIAGKLHSWIKAFLTNRTQSVKIYNHVSGPTNVTSGVIQGSVLGPILYAAYTNDIVRCFTYGKPILYADDLKVIFPIDLSDIRKSYSFIMHDLNNLSSWSKATGLLFNFNKCIVLHYGNNNPNFEYALCDHVLSSADPANDLGVIRATNLIYDEHCTNIIRRANSTCAFILRNFASRNASFMSRIFVAYIRPLLEYASQLWSPSTIDFINRIERVQRMFTKRIRSISHMTYDEHLAHLNLHRLECRRLYLDMLFLGKLKYNIIHLSLHDFSVQNSTLHNYRFISLPSSNRKSFYFFTVRSVRLWNSMHHDVTSARNFCTFRRLLHNVNFVPYLRGRV